MSEPIGDLINSLGVTYTPENGELIESALVLLKVIDPDGDVVLRTCGSEGLSWIERLGMLHAAELVDRPTRSENVDEAGE